MSLLLNFGLHNRHFTNLFFVSQVGTNVILGHVYVCLTVMFVNLIVCYILHFNSYLLHVVSVRSSKFDLNDAVNVINFNPRLNHRLS